MDELNLEKIRRSNKKAIESNPACMEVAEQIATMPIPSLVTVCQKAYQRDSKMGDVMFGSILTSIVSTYAIDMDHALHVASDIRRRLEEQDKRLNEAD